MTKVACVDDDVVFAEALARKLAARAVEMRCFASTQEFLFAIDSERYDLALVDLNMADSNGHVWRFAGMEALGALRRRLGPSVPICVVTGQDNPSLAESSRANGAVQLFSKNQSIDGLAEQITAYIADPHGIDEVDDADEAKPTVGALALSTAAG